MAEQIVIKISSTASGAGVEANQDRTTGGTSPADETAKKPEKAGKESEAKKIAKTIIIDQGRRVLTEAFNQFVDLTGNATLSNRVNLVGTLAGYTTAIVAGGVVGAVAVAVDIGSKAFTSSIEVRKANANIELLRQRVGTSTINGGRGTYD